MKKNNGRKHRVLVTGGAGFIGSHLVDELVEIGHEVTIIDNLDAQVHPGGRKPEYLNPGASFIKADIREAGVMESALSDSEVVFHLAASTAVGQSACQIDRYVNNNIQATAHLWDLLANTRHSVGKVVLASSRAVYGEGLYRCKACAKVFSASPRIEADLKRGIWDVRCPECSGFSTPLYVHEDVHPVPASIYAITKNTQEEISLRCAGALGLSAAVLRFSNVYGDRQSMSNPYVGISSIFASRVINREPIEIYEDGLESRDFVYVKDVVQACLLAMGSEKADYEVFNVGSGEVVSILDVARTIAKKLDSAAEPKVVGKYRTGDIRHLWLDISKIKKVLGFVPEYSFDRGIECFIKWVQTEKPADIYRDKSHV
ncbi:MAG: NAD-dependent epimerase/dehydratase family protein [Deltaproteobacteria bacterium]|nr:NAD-dependent epimerase/dehydratase family protein [Deltaproteobacteria bacterium]MBI5810279.1 NAD-dependent epimerase/dehydratase family protein [Deltaproteobacteria bacterium]